MKQKRKTRKLPEATVYAVRNESGQWMANYVTSAEWTSFANAWFAATRAEAKGSIFDSDGPCEVVPCRVRVLPSARKNVKRTR